MLHDTEHQGTYWVTGQEDREQSGELRWDGSQSRYILKTKRPLTELKSITVTEGGVVQSSSPSLDVEDFQKNDISGTLGSGQQVSLLESYGPGSTGLFLAAIYRVSYRVDHAHVSSMTEFARFKLRLDADYLWRNVAESSAESNDGAIEAVREDSAIYLICKPQTPLTIRNFNSRWLSPITTFVQLAYDISPSTRELYVEFDGEWKDVRSASYNMDCNTKLGDTYENITPINVSAVHLSHLLNWLDVSKRINHLDAAIGSTHKSTLALQAELLVLLSAAEGVHSGLVNDDSRLSYKTRMNELCSLADAIAPGIGGRPADWAYWAKRIRNCLMHPSNRLDLLEAENLNRAIALSYSLKWILKTVILHYVEIPDIGTQYQDTTSYHYYLANMRHLGLWW